MPLHFLSARASADALVTKIWRCDQRYFYHYQFQTCFFIIRQVYPTWLTRYPEISGPILKYKDPSWVNGNPGQQHAVPISLGLLIQITANCCQYSLSKQHDKCPCPLSRWNCNSNNRHCMQLGLIFPSTQPELNPLCSELFWNKINMFFAFCVIP